MKQKDFIFTMMALLLIIVVLLLVTPWVCSCNPASDSVMGLHRIIFGPGPVHIANTPTSTVMMPTSTTPGSTPSSTEPAPPVQAASSSAWLSPQSGPVGTAIAIHGSGFGADNTIEMNGLVGASMKNVASSNGTSLFFVVPANLGSNCQPMQACPQFLMLVTANTYKVSVTTNGTTQDIGTFTVTGGRSNSL